LVAVLLGALAAGGATQADAARERPYRIRVDAVAYHLPGKTALGIPVRKGVVAVDPKLIPLGTRMHVPGYGRSIAADVGTAIKGRIIDLWMPNTRAAREWGRRTVTITVYR
jgi:3D (Asp-Asp-Asp) domain-containing protein